MDLQTLLAEREITHALIRFARAMDERDWDVLRTILVDDATSDVGTGPLEGSEALIACIRSYLDACGRTQHLLGNILVDVTGDEAVSKAYVSDMHLSADPDSELTFATLGDYHDRWQRIDGTWRMVHRTKLNRGVVGSFAVFGMPDAGEHAADGSADGSADGALRA